LEYLLLSHILAGFTVPMQVPNDWRSFLFIIPLALVLSLVYKTTKMTEFSWLALLKESAILTASILVFMAVVAASIYAFCAVVLR
jgi:hypothetical protein